MTVGRQGRGREEGGRKGDDCRRQGRVREEGGRKGDDCMEARQREGGREGDCREARQRDGGGWEIGGRQGRGMEEGGREGWREIVGRQGRGREVVGRHGRGMEEGRAVRMVHSAWRWFNCHSPSLSLYTDTVRMQRKWLMTHCMLLAMQHYLLM